MKIAINGEPADVAEGATVAGLLAEREAAGRVAVAVNGDFVPRSEYSGRTLKEGDEIEIVAPMQGG